jgi:hypothetical protein
VSPAGFESGRILPEFNTRSFIFLRGPRRKHGFPIVANQGNYPNELNVAIPYGD